MKKVLVLGNHTQPTESVSNYNETLELNTYGVNHNVRREIDIFGTKFLRDVPKRLDDLLLIASIIYAADTSIKRGSKTDVLAEDWIRDFHFVLPVSDVSFWNMNSVKESLCDALKFLTGDNYYFEFTDKPSSEEIQGSLHFKELFDPLPKVNLVVLFSGGVDSLAATIESVQNDYNPILVSHRSAPVIDRRQKHLVELLRSKFPDWVFPHISMLVNRAGGSRSVEYSQRSRSFLFTSLGVAAATILNISNIRLCDNGIVSINLPQSGYGYSTLLSRSTHPRFLEKIQSLMQLVTDNSSLSIINTLIFKTKKEVMELIAQNVIPSYKKQYHVLIQKE